MPRLIFSDANELINWLKNHDPTRFDVYVTPENELILIPRKSTRPLLYIYFAGDDTDIKKVMDYLVDRYGYFPYYKVERVEWKEDTPIGSSFLE